MASGRDTQPDGDGRGSGQHRSAERSETPTERLDRNWNDLLQELRVAQTGVQILTGLLLTLPFQPRFVQLPVYLHTVYLVTVALSVGSTGLLIAPVGLHRALFRQHAREQLVDAGHSLALAGLALLGLAVTGVVFLIFSTVLGAAGGAVAAACAFVLLAALWGVLPWLWRLKNSERPNP
jgi:hypothetical protein